MPAGLAESVAGELVILQGLVELDSYDNYSTTSEIPASTMTRGLVDSSGSARSGPGGLLATSETRESNVLGPRDQAKVHFPGVTVAGRRLSTYRYLLSPPLGGFLTGALPGRLRVENNVVLTTD